MTRDVHRARSSWHGGLSSDGPHSGERRGARPGRRSTAREALIGSAHHHFAERGYDGVRLDEVVRSAGVSKGALYHHFGGGKRALFTAVVEQAARQVGEVVESAADDADGPWDRLRAGCRTYLAHSTRPAIARVLLLDGPALLGWARWSAVDETALGRHVTRGLGELSRAGLITPQPVEPLAQLLTGAMNRTALWLVGDSGTPVDSTLLEQAWTGLDTLLDTLGAATHVHVPPRLEAVDSRPADEKRTAETAPSHGTVRTVAPPASRLAEPDFGGRRSPEHTAVSRDAGG